VLDSAKMRWCEWRKPRAGRRCTVDGKGSEKREARAHSSMRASERAGRRHADNERLAGDVGLARTREVETRDEGVGDRRERDGLAIEDGPQIQIRYRAA